MSSLSRNESNAGGGNITYDGLRQNVSRNIQMQGNHHQAELNHLQSPSQLSQPLLPPTHASAQLMQWPNHPMGTASYVHAPHHQHQHLYNIHTHTQAVAPASAVGMNGTSGGPQQQESYSMLRMCDGNFLKIYHCADNSIMSTVTPSEASFATLPQNIYNYQTQSPQQQQHLQTAYHHHHHHHHMSQQNVLPSSTNTTQLISNQAQSSQHQQPEQQIAATAPQHFNSYELFSSNTFSQLRTTDIAPVLLVGPKKQNTNTHNNNHNEVSNINSNNYNVTKEVRAEMPNDNSNILNNNTTELDNGNSNVIISNLVNNWSQNLMSGGTYSQFGTQYDATSPVKDKINMSPAAASETTAKAANTNQTQENKSIEDLTALVQEQQHQEQHQEIDMGNISVRALSQVQMDVTVARDEPTMSTMRMAETAPSSENILQMEYKDKSPQEIKPTTTILLNDNGLIADVDTPRQEIAMAPKKRIVAEVKPMRMTYSDVLSKFNSNNIINNKQQQEEQKQQQQQQLLQYNQNPIQNNTSSYKGTTAPVTPISRSNVKSNKLEPTITSTNTNNNNTIKCRITDENNLTGMKIVKKSPTHDNKENVLNSVTQQMVNGKSINNNTKQRTNVILNNNNNSVNAHNNATTSHKPTPQFQKQQNHIKNSVETENGNGIDTATKKRNVTTSKNLTKDKDMDQMRDHRDDGSKNYQERRNLLKCNGSSNAANNLNNALNCSRKATKSSKNQIINNNNNAYINGTPSQQQQQTHRLHRFQSNTTASNVSYSYSTAKRARHNNANNSNNNSSGSNTSHNNNNHHHNFNQYNGNNFSYILTGSRQNSHQYDLAKRVLMVWLTYTMKILTWLFYLIYDIIVLGCSILYDHIEHLYESSCIYIRHIYKDIKQNSNKPSQWLKNRWKRFDAYFEKNSKWAFWRHFCEKKLPETTNENVKSGRLPQTGEEAMYSLLNCKGKDAYSILGVPSNCSTEQIRKHYKKIAVLVHPDKNKQPGAEEAFKVLQRAFELIGEPENRTAYDQSLAEALHAEKAWTELHDLLSQLQTKITEAANTIRCSTCGLRHPRKLTDRAHYAARECATCKIRHSAREGDIWAETSMMGLRWKYLALMEGKVYDITEWANCQRGALAHLEPNSHMVQYRIVRGAQQQQRQQQKQQQQQQQSHQNDYNNRHRNTRSSTSNQQMYYGNGNDGVAGGGRIGANRNNKFKCGNVPPSESSLHDFLDNLYSGQHPHGQQNNTSTSRARSSASNRRRSRRN